MAKFIDIFDDVTKQGRKIPTNQYLLSGKYPIIDQGQALFAGYTDEDEGLFEDVPAIIFGDHTRIIKYIDKPCFLGADGVKLLKAKIENANYKYLYYALVNAKIPNTGYNRHFKWLKETEIPLPEEHTQKKIVLILEKLEILIKQRKEQLTKLDELVKARFVEMFGDPTDNPNDFPIKRIDEVAELVKGITYSPEEVCDNEGIVVLRSSNIKGSTFDLQDIVTISKKISSEKLVKENDILMCNRNGSARLVGKVALIPKLNEDMTFGTFMTIVRSEMYKYLFVFFQMEAFRRQIQFQTAVAINQISLPLLAGVTVPIPPIELQNQFAAFVEQVDKSKFEVKQSLDKLETLKKALMQKYFG